MSLKKCEIEPDYFEHDFYFVRDWFGDPGVPNGTQDCSYYRCAACGFESFDPESHGNGGDEE